MVQKAWRRRGPQALGESFSFNIDPQQICVKTLALAAGSKTRQNKSMQKHVAIIDPAVESPANHCFNQIVSLSEAPLRYYLPAFNKADSDIEFAGLKGVILLGSFANVDQQREWQKPLSKTCLLYTSPSPRDATLSRMPSSA